MLHSSLLSVVVMRALGYFFHENKNMKEIVSIKIPLYRACQNRYPDHLFSLTVMIPEMMPRAICCKSHFK